MDWFEKHRRPLSQEDINDLPLRRYTGPIHVVRSKKKLKAALDDLERETYLGFDTETQPSFEKGMAHPPALVQLAGSEAVYVFQFNFLSFSPALAEVLENPDIVKAGVAVRDDIKGLQELVFFKDAGFVDLGEVSRNLNCPTNGLRNMAANFLGFRISKGARRSNWGVRQLTQSQIVYAATDAWVSREIYQWMKTRELL